MKSMILLFSHKLTEEQRYDAVKSLGIEKFIYLPNILQEKWSNVSENNNDVEEFKKFILDNYTLDDYILVQGEYGMTFNIVNWAINKGYKVIYSFSKREYINKILSDGTIENTHYFKHIRYKMYK